MPLYLTPVLNKKTVTVTTSYNISLADGTIMANAATASLNVVLPDASLCPNQQFIVKKSDTDETKAVIIMTTGGQTIDGNTPTLAGITTAGLAVMYQSNGTGWFRVGAYIAPTAGTLFTNTNMRLVTNTTVELSVLPTAGTGIKSVPANWFTPGRTMKAFVRGNYQTPGLPGDVQVRVKLNSTVLGTVTAAAGILAANSQYRDVWGEITITCLTTGVNGTFVSSGFLAFETGSAAGVVIIPFGTGKFTSNAQGTSVLDTTIAYTFDVTEQWTNAQVQQGTVINSFILREERK